ncbi:MAG TPA: ATP-binding protein [Nitrososphaeraceae archaeon]|nr:ATP-binding protein [Nitrososphaeraceae archaeon]
MNEKIKVLHRAEVINAISDIFYNAEHRIDVCGNSRFPSFIFSFESIRTAMINTKNRKYTAQRYIFEITQQNLQYCKDLMRIAEIHHMNEIEANFLLNEREYLGSIILSEPHQQAIHTNMREIVEQQQNIFETLWNKSIHAEKKIKEIEEGTVHYETRLIEDSQEIIKEIGRLTATSTELSTCLTAGGLQYSYNHFFDIKKKLLDKQKKGEHKGIRYISNIDKDNVNLAKTLLNAGIEIRYVKNLPPMSFGVSDKEIAATIEKMEDGKNVQSLLLSNEPVYVNHFYHIFEELWKNGIDAKDRIRDIEEDIESAIIEIIPNPSYSIKRAYDLINSAQEEVLRIFSSINAFHRQVRLGIMHLFKDAIERGVRVRILIPADQKEIIQIVNEVNLVLPQLETGSVDKSLESTVGILVVDRKESLIIETKNDTKVNSYDAAGIAAYSNSKPIASAYASIFDTLWTQTALHQKLSDMYERLRIQSKMQEEFINIAAHELRTPIQPILSLTSILRSNNRRDKTSSVVKQDEMLDVIMRNATRLQRLANDILDATKIESKSLTLKKESFNLNDVITNSIDDVIRNIANNSQQQGDFIKLLYQPCDIFIHADKSRIAQVISNILDNAVKFSKANVNKESGVGIIKINTEKVDDRAIVTITDTGTGLDPEIMPRLFDKFASKSFQGTGLGLYICKSIVQAHGGKIRAENNKDDKWGATFTFSLPIS